MSAIQISDDEMDAVCILQSFFSSSFSYVVFFFRIRILNVILNQIQFDMKLSNNKNQFLYHSYQIKRNHQLMVTVRCQPKQHGPLQMMITIDRAFLQGI